MNNEMLRAVYAFMVEHGTYASKDQYSDIPDWNQYGDCWELFDFKLSKTENRDLLKSKIREHGVNWSCMALPVDREHGCFNGTYAEGSYKERTHGVIVLKNGERCYIGMDFAMKLSEYAIMFTLFVNDKEKIAAVFPPS